VSGTLVSLLENPIERITPAGILLADGSHADLDRFARICDEIVDADYKGFTFS
jgi:hypothetical protein